MKCLNGAAPSMLQRMLPIPSSAFCLVFPALCDPAGFSESESESESRAPNPPNTLFFMEKAVPFPYLQHFMIFSSPLMTVLVGPWNATVWMGRPYWCSLMWRGLEERMS